MRPDDREKRAIIPRDYLMDATDWHRVDPPFRPGYEKRYFGYGNQFWLFPGETRRFAPIGVYGQIIFVDPQLKLVMVQTTANATAMADGTSLARERDAFWRGGWFGTMGHGEADEMPLTQYWSTEVRGKIFAEIQPTNNPDRPATPSSSRRLSLLRICLRSR